jgi:uncharacterized protein (DUF433 family)
MKTGEATYFDQGHVDRPSASGRLRVCDAISRGGDGEGSQRLLAGMRLPVAARAAIGETAQGSTPSELLESYPRLTADMIRLAPVYAAAYPLRGLRRKQPWRDQQPVRRGRRKLDAIAVS